MIGLGTERHARYIEGIDNLEVVGCFCLTELGYGNNAVEMETVAVWDETEKRFTINTPTILSQKYWITNGAYHANYAIVFAQTMIKSKNEGINAFVVRLRDDNGQLCKGVVIDDMGHKMGMNGVDNARIILRDVKIEKNDLLNKISDIDDNGSFHSSVSNRRQRFLVAANRLLSGRLCIASMMIAGAKQCLLATNKYGSTRLSNGRKGKSDTPIGSYQLFQNGIVPLICKTIVYNIGLLDIRRIYSDYILHPDKYDSNYFNNVVRLCCVIKSLLAWHANETANICRERCGGQGYLSINKIESLVAGAHSGITAEGDSAVLMQKVSKEYVEDYIKKIVNPPELSQSIESIGKLNDVFQITTLYDLIKHRETKLLERLAERTMNNMTNLFNTWMLEESDLIQDLASMYGERYCLQQAYEKLNKSK